MFAIRRSGLSGIRIRFVFLYQQCREFLFLPSLSGAGPAFALYLPDRLVHDVVRLKRLCILCPEICIATFSEKPARIMLWMAVLWRTIRTGLRVWSALFIVRPRHDLPSQSAGQTYSQRSIKAGRYVRIEFKEIP